MSICSRCSTLIFILILIVHICNSASSDRYRSRPKFKERNRIVDDTNGSYSRTKSLRPNVLVADASTLSVPPNTSFTLMSNTTDNSTSWEDSFIHFAEKLHVKLDKHGVTAIIILISVLSVSITLLFIAIGLEIAFWCIERRKPIKERFAFLKKIPIKR